MQNARPFDPNNRPLKGEWVEVTDSGDTVTMPAIHEHIDASLTQGHDIVTRQVKKRPFPIWAIIVLVLAVCAIGLGVTQLMRDGSKSKIGTSSDAGTSSNEEASTSQSNAETNSPQSTVSESERQQSSPVADNENKPANSGAGDWICSTCKTKYGALIKFCPDDGTSRPNRSGTGAGSGGNTAIQGQDSESTGGEQETKPTAEKPGNRNNKENRGRGNGN